MGAGLVGTWARIQEEKEDAGVDICEYVKEEPSRIHLAAAFGQNIAPMVTPPVDCQSERDTRGHLGESSGTLSGKKSTQEKPIEP